MKNVEKKLVSLAKKADAKADIALINQHSLKELTPDDVFVFAVNLCNNDIDRDDERFTDTCLEKLAGLFIDKPGIFDHCWTAKGQKARIYRCEVVTFDKKTAFGTPFKALRACAYMLRSEDNKSLIEAIEGGILKEVSVGLSVKSRTCSICGQPLYECGHRKGQKYDGKTCCGVLDDPADAFEFSFVAVPAQPGAGVTKGKQDASGAFKILMTADLSGETENIKQLMPVLQKALIANDEMLEREKIRKAAEKILSKKEN